MTRPILIVSSLDTKGHEVKFLKELIEQRGQQTILLDLGMRNEFLIPADITCEDVAKAGGMSMSEIKTSSKGMDEITSMMTKGAIKKAIELFQSGKLSGIVGVGGVSNTTMATDIMKALPFGVPKLMVSSGAAMPSYAGGFFGSSDIAIISSVVDMAGLHELSKSILIRAAGAICGMVETGAGAVMNSLKQTNMPLVAMTEFHYSDICCKFVKEHLEEKEYKVIPCHAQGVGDRAMDKLLDQGIFDGVVDIVPSGLSEELFGGNRAAGPDRLETAGERGIPQIITPCGFEMISCGPLRRKDSGDPLWISRNLANRSCYLHDAYRVQARTNADELRLVAKTVAEKLNKAKGSVKFIIPEKGWSTLSVKGQPLFDPDADKAFADELRKHLKPEIELMKLEVHLNTPEFAMAVVETFDKMMKDKGLDSNIFN
ncbi:MAG: Tm-1-like ATP-binding domain-containing protein [Deltaproteobacteria bacterium]|nr:Tm-1-like ATP-binding domain-containing protein [Deltaproteobacteria bacterium]